MFFEQPKMEPISFQRDPKLDYTDVDSGGAVDPKPLANASFLDVFDKADKAAQQADAINAYWLAREAAIDRRNEQIKSTLGIDLGNPFQMRMPSPEQIKRGVAGHPYQFYLQRLAELAEKHPEHRKMFEVDRDEEASVYLQSRRSEQELAEALASNDSWTGNVATFAGAMYSIRRDPVNLSTIAAGFNGAKAGLRGLLWTATKNAGLNAAIELAQQPIVQSYRGRAGLESGVDQAAFNTLAAAVFGFGLDAGGRAVSRGIQGSLGRVPITDDKGHITGWQKPGDAEAPSPQGVPGVPDERPEVEGGGEPQTISRADVEKIDTGDIETVKRVAKDLGVDDDPALRGAIADAESEDALLKAARESGIDIDSGDDMAKLAKALRATVDEDEPPPLHFAPVEVERTAPSLPEQAETSQKITIDDKPVMYRNVDLKSVEVDPELFQFKSGGDARGVTDRLSGVKEWDPLATGKAVLFERADGKLIVADGHQRTGLAQRLSDAETEAPAFVFREADGWTPADVRAIAAKKNLQEGSASPIDAAKIMRDRPDIIDDTVPLRSSQMQVARSLSRLSDEAFDMVVGGASPERHAALVADLAPDKSRHASILRELSEIDPQTAREARLAISDILQSDTFESTQLTLLGAHHSTQSLRKERIKVLDAALKELRQDTRTFGLLGREAERISGAGNRLAKDENARLANEAAAALDLLERLATQRGTVSEWVSGAARSIAEGQPTKRAGEALANRIRKTLDEEGIAGLMREQPEPAKIDDPGGPEAADQTQALLFSIGGEGRASNLDMSQEARMQRARDMGFDTDRILYHGTKQGETIASFELDKIGAATGNDHGGFWFTNSWDEANLYGKMADGAANDYGAVHRYHSDVGEYYGPVHVKIVDVGDIAKRLKDEMGAPDAAFSEVMGTMDSWVKEFVDEAKSDGYSGIRFVNIEDHPLSGYGYNHDPTDHTLIFDPSNIRSVNAAFDPAQEASARLLASHSSAPTPLAAIDLPAIRKEIDAIAARLPDTYRMELEDRLVFRDARGIDREVEAVTDPYEQLIKVSLATNNPARFARHEEIHVYRQLGLFTDDEWQAMTRNALDNGLRESYDIDARYSELYAGRHNDPNKLEEMLIEETIAEMWADRIAGKSFGPTIDAIIDRVVRFINQIAKMLGRKGYTRIEDVYQRIESGEIGRRQSLDDGVFETTRFASDSIIPEQDDLGFVSGLLEAAKRLKQNKGTPEQMLAQLKKAGAKEAEIDLTSLRQVMEGEKTVTKQDIIEHLELSRTQVLEGKYSQGWTPEDEMRLANDTGYPTFEKMAEEYGVTPDELRRDASETFGMPSNTKWSSYSLDPSNPTYRETVLHLPSTRVEVIDMRLGDINREINSLAGPPEARRDVPEASVPRFRQLRDEAKSLSDERANIKRSEFRNGHFDEPNAISHIRSSIQPDSEGKQNFVINELQSDWGQKIRDSGGVRDEAKIAELKSSIEPMSARLREINDEIDDLVSEFQKRLGVPEQPSRIEDLLRYEDAGKGFEDIQSRFQKLDKEREGIDEPLWLRQAELKAAEQSVEGHPLVNTTDQWVNTSLRRALRQAVEEGADYIAIASGETVDSFNMGAPLEGLQYAYNQMYPKKLRDIIKKIDKDAAKPEKIEAGATGGLLGSIAVATGERNATDYGSGTSLLTHDGQPLGKGDQGFVRFPITEKLRAKIMTEGQPLFSFRGEMDATQRMGEVKDVVEACRIS